MDPSGEHAATPELRAADVDRQRVVDRLAAAHAEGRLDLHEFDERLAAVWAARTYGELAELTKDLPAASPVAGHSSVPAGPSTRGPDKPDPLRGVASAWLGVSMLNLMIWAVISVSTWEFIYPWWIWVAGPWGVVLLMVWLASKGRSQEADRKSKKKSKAKKKSRKKSKKELSKK